MFWTIVLVLSAFIALVYALVRPFYYWTRKGVRQITMRESWRDYFKRYSLADRMWYYYDKCGNSRYLGIYLFFNPTLIVRDAELLKQLTVKDFDHFTDHLLMIYDPEYEPLWCKNLLILRGSEWRHMRSTLSPAFTSSKMKGMFSLMLKCSKQFVGYLEEEQSQLMEVDLKEIFGKYACDVIASCAFGIECDSMKDGNNEFFVMAKEANNFFGFKRVAQLITLIALPKLAKLLGIHIFPQKTMDFFTRVIEESVKYREENNVIRPDLIHLLMEAKKGTLKHEDESETELPIKDELKTPTDISLMDMVAHAFSFFFAGYEPVSNMLSFLVYELAVNVDIQERLYEEIVQCSLEFDGDISYERLNRMKYLDMVLTETLRKWPPNLATDRLCTKPYTIQPKNSTTENPVHLNIGDQLIIPIWAFHYDPEIYPNPTKFDPERFSDANKPNVNPYTYLPFGIGPRLCIGSRFALLEVKTMVYHLLLKFEFVVVEKTPIPLELKKSALSMKTDKDMIVGLKKR